MELVICLGAHGMGADLLADDLIYNAKELEAHGVRSWLQQGVSDTTAEVFSVILNSADAAKRKGAEARLKLLIEQAPSLGCRALVFSDENAIGTRRDNITEADLYPSAGERIGRLSRAMGEQISKLVLSIEPLEAYWTRLLTEQLRLARPVATARKLDMLAQSSRSWRDLVRDLNRAVPEAELRVIEHTERSALPRNLLSLALDRQFPEQAARQTPQPMPDLMQLRTILEAFGQDPTQLPQGDGPWEPFSETQSAALKERYNDDIFWLTAGADGMATFIKEDHLEAQTSGVTRGQENDQKNRLDQAG
jgi:hypothetical protein